MGDHMSKRYRHPYRFFFWSAAIPWTLWSCSAYLSHQPGAEDDRWLIGSLGLAGLIAPLLIAIHYLRKDRPLMRDALSRIAHVPEGSGRYVLMAIALMPVSILAAMAISLILGYDPSQFAVTGETTFRSALFPVWFLLISAPILEELAWHSYGTDSLRRRFSLFTTSMVFAVYWAAWHLPLAFIDGYYHSNLADGGLLHGLNFVVGLFPFVLLMNWLYYKTGRNILVSVAVHLAANVFNELFAPHPDSKVIQTGLLLLLTAYLLMKDRKFFFDTGGAQNRVRSSTSKSPSRRISGLPETAAGKRSIVAGVLTAFALVLPTSANAGDGSLTLTVGAGIGTMPDYEGSDDYDFVRLPLLSLGWASDSVAPEGGKGLQLGLHDVTMAFPPDLDVGLAKLYRPEGVYRASIGVSYAGGRDQDDNPDLQGMGDIDAHALLKTRFKFDAEDSGWRAEIEFAKSLGLDDGGETVRGRIGYAVTLAPGLKITPSVESTWASREYMQTHFGVSQAQAETSAYSRFTPDGGIKAVRLGAQLEWAIGENWMVNGNLGISQLVHHAADSPIVKDRGDATQVDAFVSVNYTF